MDMLEKLKTNNPARFFYEIHEFIGAPGLNHRNIARYMVAMSLELIKANLPHVVWVMQTRNDQLVRMPNVIYVLKQLVLSREITDSRGTGAQHYRLLFTDPSAFSGHCGWCWINDNFAFGHVDDLLQYWGFNEYWNTNEYFSRRVERNDQHQETFPGQTCVETELCQIWLRVLGKAFKYTNARKLFSERMIFVRSNIILNDIWNRHYENEIDNDLSAICNEVTGPIMKINEFNQNCWNWGMEERALQVSTACKIKSIEYDCSPEEGQTYSGEYEGLNDIYDEDGWTYNRTDPIQATLEASFQEKSLVP
jgi:hypothetical protein